MNIFLLTMPEKLRYKADYGEYSIQLKQEKFKIWKMLGKGRFRKKCSDFFADTEEYYDIICDMRGSI